eukprot:394162-Karenia_brevis.AAC.1
MGVWPPQEQEDTVMGEEGKPPQMPTPPCADLHLKKVQELQSLKGMWELAVEEHGEDSIQAKTLKEGMEKYGPQTTSVKTTVVEKNFVEALIVIQKQQESIQKDKDNFLKTKQQEIANLREQISKMELTIEEQVKQFDLDLENLDRSAKSVMEQKSKLQPSPTMTPPAPSPSMTSTSNTYIQILPSQLIALRDQIFQSVQSPNSDPS